MLPMPSTRRRTSHRVPLHLLKFWTVFIDAPHVLTPVDLAEAFRSSESESSSLNDLGAQEASTDSDPALAPRGWWKADAARTKTIGIEDSILQLRDVLSKDHYDGIFGFR